MEIILVLLKQNLIMLLYLIIGWTIFKKKLVTKAGSGEIGKILLYVIMPAAIVKSYIREFNLETLRMFGVSFIMAVMVLIAAILVSRICFGDRHVIEHFGAAFSNAGFIGIPLVQVVLGEESVFYMASFVAVLNILQWTYGVAIMEGTRDRITIKKVACNPIVISLGIGFVLFFFSVEVPNIVMNMLGTLSSMNAPIAMILLGIYLAQIPIRELFTGSLVYKCSMLRLVVIPLLTILILSVLPDGYRLVKLAILIAASAPVGSNVAIFAQITNKNYTQAVKDVCVSTLCCIVTMPAILGIANYIW